MNLDRILSVVTVVVSVGTLLLGVAAYIHLSGVGLGNIQNNLGVLNAEVKDLKVELRAELKDLRADMKDLRAELKADVKGVKNDVKKIDEKLDSLAVRQERFDGELKFLKANQADLAGKLKILDENVKNIDKKLQDPPIDGQTTTPSE